MTVITAAPGQLPWQQVPGDPADLSSPSGKEESQSLGGKARKRPSTLNLEAALCSPDL